MAGRASLNAKNLEALGTARLAKLLLQHTEGNAAARRALRLALAEQRGPLEMAQEVRNNSCVRGWATVSRQPSNTSGACGHRRISFFITHHLSLVIVKLLTSRPPPTKHFCYYCFLISGLCSWRLPRLLSTPARARRQ